MSIADKILALQSDSAAIASAIAAKGVTVPAGSGYDDYATLIGQISGGGGGGGPYDSEIEYIQNTGNQYIYPGFVLGTNSKCEIKAQLVQNLGAYDTLFGSITNSTVYSVILAFQPGGSPYTQIGDGNSYVTSSASALLQHTYTITFANNTLSLDVDGSTVSRAKSGTASAWPLLLFARFRYDTIVGNPAMAKVYYVKIWNNNTLVRDFIPVRIGQIGYMYDRVTGILFGNIGAGNFTLGPDI